MSTDDKRYNGWSNYETWNVALWIDDEEPLYRERCEMAERIVSDNPVTRGGSRKDVQHARISELAEALENWIEDMRPEIEFGLFSDLLNAALSEVDWYEIAEHWIDEAVEAVSA